MNLRILTIIAIFFTGIAFSQPELELEPNEIEFEDIFNRFDQAYFINKGNQPLTIDSLTYEELFYIIDFENNQQLPFTILPDDSVKMNIRLSGFYYVTMSDTADTIYIYNDGIQNPEALLVKIDFFEDEFGSFNGTVSADLNPVENAKVYFFYSGIYLIDTAITDATGNYEITLPEGEYTVATEKEGYYVVFHDSTYDPYFASFVELAADSVKTIDFNLLEIIDTTFSVSGEVYDSVNGFPFPDGIVVIRRGKHVPTLRSPKLLTQDSLSTFAGFIKPDGTFKINVQYDGYYYVQAYTNSFLPGYYNSEGNASVFWQDADSLLIDNSIIDKNINLVRDSSYGGGTMSGFVDFSLKAGQSDFEGITLLARSLDNGELYSYNFGKENGGFKITNIPFGTYEIIGQKIGVDNAISEIITIDPLNNQINGIIINFNATDVTDEELPVPNKITLYPNYPNPFNPSTTISFSLPESERVVLRIVNILGETVKVLANEEFPAGKHQVIFNADRLASGMYIVLLETSVQLKSQKILLLK
jgi:Secretion system C-terminal sorting domain